MSDHVRIDRRFRGPADSANGGYAAGLLASFLDGPAEVTLRLPPRVYASLPSRACTASQPSPSIATSSSPPVCTSVPCERSNPKPDATVLTRLA